MWHITPHPLSAAQCAGALILAPVPAWLLPFPLAERRTRTWWNSIPGGPFQWYFISFCEYPNVLSQAWAQGKNRSWQTNRAQGCEVSQQNSAGTAGAGLQLRAVLPTHSGAALWPWPTGWGHFWVKLCVLVLIASSSGAGWCWLSFLQPASCPSPACWLLLRGLGGRPATCAPVWAVNNTVTKLFFCWVLSLRPAPKLCTIGSRHALSCAQTQCLLNQC